jgi:hypothetical protein
MLSLGDFFLVVIVANDLFFDMFGKIIRFLEGVFDIRCNIKIGDTGGGVNDAIHVWVKFQTSLRRKLMLT